MSYEKIEGAKVSVNQFGYVFDLWWGSPCWGDSFAVISRRGLTYVTLDEIKRVTIAVEKSVEVAPLLVKRLSIAAVSCDSAE